MMDRNKRLVGVLLTAWTLLVIFTTPGLALGPRARNVILLIGDGMGGWHVDATRKYLQIEQLNMESLQFHGYMTTFMLNSIGGGKVDGEYWDDAAAIGSYDPSMGGLTPWFLPTVPDYVQQGATDSAAAASAMADGHKNAQYTLNVVAKPDGYDSGQPHTVKYYPTIVDFAEAEGRATGLVTSVTFNHATPAGFVVKTQYRKNYGEKARQMVYSNVDVIMGAGHPNFDDNGAVAASPDYGNWSQNRAAYLEDQDGAVLYQQVVNGLKGRVYLETKQDFQDLADGDGLFRGQPDIPRRVFGLAQVAATLQNDRAIDDGNPDNDWQVGGQAPVPNVPTLATMTKAALAALEQDEDGLFLMVEGGAIDWASHANNMTRMLEEAIDFDQAVKAVIDWVKDPENGSNWDNTLVIVTADHETGHLQPTGHFSGDDVITHQCWGSSCGGWSSHTNSLVPIYAQGPGAHRLRARFDGDYTDNTEIFSVMYSALTHCFAPSNPRR